MGKLRHIAIAVPDTDAAAKFYEQAFGMKRVRESVSSVMLSDGVISLAILNNKTSHEALGQDDVEQTAADAERSGAVYADSDENVAKRFANRGQMKDGKVTESAQKQAQRKYVDPNGIKFDIVNGEHARNSWRLPI